MKRVVVVGLGPIGNRHADIYSEYERCDLAGVCDVIPERAEAAGRRLGVPWYTDARRMFEQVDADICSVATGGFEYASDHHEPTIAALEAGLHVLCEKPISNELAPAEEMVQCAADRNLCFGVDFNHRFTPACWSAEQWVADGAVGDLLFCNMALWIGKFGEFESVNYHLKALNPHSIDLMMHFCGAIREVQCFATKAPRRNIWSTASFNVRFENGAVGHLTSSYDIERGHPMERCEVAGTSGRFVIDDMWREATLYPAGSPEKRVYTNPVFGGYSGFHDTFRARLRRFVQQVDDGVSPDDIDGSGRDAVEGLRVILAGIESLNSGTVVTLPSH